MPTTRDERTGEPLRRNIAKLYFRGRERERERERERSLFSPSTNPSSNLESIDSVVVYDVPIPPFGQLFFENDPAGH